MSGFELVDRVVCHSAAAGTAKLVLIGIARHSGRNGAWPSTETLAGYANVSERSVRAALRVLEDLGELATETRPGTSNRYVVTVACPLGCVIHTPEVSFRGGAEASFRGGRKPASGEQTNEPTTTNPENVTYLNAGEREAIDKAWDALIVEARS